MNNGNNINDINHTDYIKLYNYNNDLKKDYNLQ
jgi:hypothetical protein